jgi:hypothetical protein
MSIEAELTQRYELDNSPIANYDAHINKQDSGLTADYVQITAGKESYYFRVKDNTVGEANLFVVNDKSFTLNGLTPIKHTPITYKVTYEEASKYDWLKQKAKYDTEQRTAFIGLLLGILGFIIDACFDIGKVKSSIQIAPPETVLSIEYADWVVIIKCISWALKIVGLFLVFWKGLISSK